ncbi:MAG: slipin family protein [Planctomycetes bacterium]|nr:slipin family protein [Planctomycetota bacterium]
MFIPIRIHQGTAGLLFRGGDFAGVLPPGRFWARSFLFGAARDRVQIADTTGGFLSHPQLDLIVRHPSAARALDVVDVADHERIVVRKNGRVAWVLGPGRYAFWKEPHRIEVQRFDTADLRLRTPNPDAVLAASEGKAHLTDVNVPADHELLVFRDGRLIDRVVGERYVHWTRAGRVTTAVVDRREQVLDVAGQEIMTQDKVTLRVHLIVSYRVTDAVRAVGEVADVSQAVYREAQLALRAAVGGRSIDVLLSDKEAVGAEIRGVLAKRSESFGVAVLSVGLRDVTLPGDMKTILNQVITASKEAEANLIRRREETAAARSQANTARLLQDNPALARLKELEMLQTILAGTKTTFVLGPGDLTAQIKTLVAPE